MLDPFRILALDHLKGADGPAGMHFKTLSSCGCLEPYMFHQKQKQKAPDKQAWYSVLCFTRCCCAATCNVLAVRARFELAERETRSSV